MGFLSIIGARYAAGCTCGHGVSGVSEFVPSSIAAAVAIFAGGIATGGYGPFYSLEKN